ncbi:MAG TPA: sugar ABC transporter substrate-binding protein [Rectinema sp.]|jgi:ribose transport system substrate-binding protein|nr:sugar ABC transporter substrate-binding protein [Spirochaetota bacterium]HNP93758.1 sugar ABC transporter substrate-binding protein [Rectinema sp.]HNT59901.1 sugar ABC transporter substrate-binding protein [Rectinema sp.]HNZ93802.1 sugar ABC transporter substrate-binding protein [Rectinema sp.]HOE99440.1 sugar ABC transporter substrate-binding protein [Rectinema sp.]
MKKMKRFVSIILMVAFVFAISAPAFAADKRLKVGVVLKTLSSQYWKIVAAGAKTAAQNNNVDLILLGPPTEDAIEQQINMVQDVLSQNIDVLVFSPSQPAASVNVLLQAKAKKIPVILVDTGMPEGFNDYASFIGTDNLAAGKAGGKALASQLKPGSKVLLIDGAPGNPACNDRIKGAEEVLKASGMIIAAKQPAYSDREKGYTVTQNVLQANPDINGVFSANDEMALGALRAMQQAGKRVPIIGVDATEDALKSILAGEMYGSVAQGNYDMGLLAIEKAIELKAGKTIEKRIDSGATLITKENAQDLLDFRMSIKD